MGNSFSHSDNDSCPDFVSKLPPRIAAKILLFLPNREIFLTHSIVTKKWHQFISSRFFLEEFIKSEFGFERSRQFLLKDDNLAKLFDSLSNERLFQRRGFVKDQFGEVKPCLRLPKSVENVHELLAKLKTTVSRQRCEEEPISLVKSDDNVDQTWWLINLAKLFKHPDLVGPILDNLRMPIVISVFSICDEQVTLLDNNLEIVRKQDLVDGQRWLVMNSGNYPKGVRYIAIENELGVQMRFTFPTQAERFQLVARLFPAIHFKNMAEIDDLLEKEPFLAQMKDPFGQDTTLYEAVRSQDVDIARRLLDLGADANARNKYRRQTALSEATKWDQEMTALLLERGADFNTKIEGWTPLHGATIGSAIMGRNGSSAELLIANGADINERHPISGNTLLIELVKDTRRGTSYQCEMIRRLVYLGANINAKDAIGKTALDHAKAFRLTKVAKCLEACLDYVNEQVD